VKLSAKRPGTSTCFSDSSKGELLLRFSWDQDGSVGVSFHLYDALGRLVADSDGMKPLVPLQICADDGEVLLAIPDELDAHICYRLYNSAGVLLTSSDGGRTSIFRFLAMDHDVRAGEWRAPSASTPDSARSLTPEA
jgi:hypothetical protein